MGHFKSGKGIINDLLFELIHFLVSVTLFGSDPFLVSLLHSFLQVTVEEGLGWSESLSIFFFFGNSLPNTFLDLLNILVSTLCSMFFDSQLFFLSEGPIPQFDLLQLFLFVFFNLLTVGTLNSLVVLKYGVSVNFVRVCEQILDFVFLNLFLLHASDFKVVEKL